MSTLNVHQANTPKNRPVMDSEFIDRTWARQLRWAYRRLRSEGVSRSTARLTLHTAFCVGSSATSQYHHEQRLAEIRNRGAA